MKNIEKQIFGIQSEQDFNMIALEVFHYQAIQNKIYARYLQLLSIDHRDIHTIEDIPFLPIELFKNHTIISGDNKPGIVFESSGTTSQLRSRHYIVSESLYQESFRKGFELFYGNVQQYCILALLPSYLERKNSSLVYMMHHLIQTSNNNESSFYLDNLDQLTSVLQRRKEDLIPTLLVGVSFALLELAEKYPINVTDNIILMETGGMKGRRAEMTRKELHESLTSAFHCSHIHSEYGMTEMLSQAYSRKNGIFETPPWLKIIIRDPYDPFTVLKPGASGGVNIIDLANIYSCSFIETSDTGRLLANGTFEISGRLDQSEIRGCNLMVI